MLTTNQIKYTIQKHAPKFVFKIIYNVWLKVLSPSVFLIDKLRLSFFKDNIFKDFNYENVKFKINLSPKNGTVDNEIYLRGVYEPYFLSVIKRELKDGDIFVDIGANIGQHSLFASQIVGESGKVISFEPVLRIYEQFKSSIQKNTEENEKSEKCNNIKLYNLGCGEEDKTVNIYSTENNMGGSSVVNSEGKFEISEIKIVKADEILKKELEKIEKKNLFIKIDVEGYEYEALLGLQEAIKNYKPKIFLEYSLDSYNQQNQTQNTPSPSLIKRREENSIIENKGRLILNMLLNFGYTIYDLEDNDKVLNKNSFDNFIKNNMQQTNLLCKII